MLDATPVFIETRAEAMAYLAANLDRIDPRISENFNRSYIATGLDGGTKTAIEGAKRVWTVQGSPID